MSTRRTFLRETAGHALAVTGLSRHSSAEGGLGTTTPAAEAAASDTDSDIGSLYPFVRSQAVDGEFPLSFLRSEFDNLGAWKTKARGVLRDLLHYAPPPAPPRSETL